MNEPELKFKNTYHYPECRKKLELCKKMVYAPACAVAANIVVGIIALILMGGFSMDNGESASLFGAIVFWSFLTGIPCLFIMMNFKTPCILGCVAFMLMTAFIGNGVMMLISFIGVLLCVVALFYIMEHEDLMKVEGYPNFRDDEEYEYLRPSRTAPMQITPKRIEYTAEERLRHLERMENLDKIKVSSKGRYRFTLPETNHHSAEYERVKAEALNEKLRNGPRSQAAKDHSEEMRIMAMHRRAEKQAELEKSSPDVTAETFFNENSIVWDDEKDK